MPLDEILEAKKEPHTVVQEAQLEADIDAQSAVEAVDSIIKSYCV
jgi:hypothetical protein